MGRTRRRYPPAFRQQLIELALGGRTPEQLSKEFEPSAQTILVKSRGLVRTGDRRDSAQIHRIFVFVKDHQAMYPAAGQCGRGRPLDNCPLW